MYFMSILTRKQIKIPTNPGVYFFKDAKGGILYIGKAANLKSRIRSYFDSRPKDPRITKMLASASRVDFQETDSEIEALILESQLIKKHQPLFNIMLRDDKQYFYVIFTGETFPKIFITHQPKGLPFEALAKEGPFTDGTALKITLKMLRRIFPYCTCKQKHNNYCLNYHLGNCPGFCCLKRETTVGQVVAYKKNVAAIKEILSGKKKSLIKRFEKEMNTLAKKGNLEKAIEFRDKIEKLKRIFENARIITERRDFDISKYQSDDRGVLEELKRKLGLKNIPHRIEGYDISNIQGKFATGAMVVFTDGQPDKNEYRKFKIHSIGGDTQMLAEILHRRFNHPEWRFPDLILIDGGKGQLNAAVSALKKSNQKIPVVALTKNLRHRGDHIFISTKKSAVPLKNLPVPVRNLILQIDAEAHRFAIGYYRRLHRRY